MSFPLTGDGFESGVITENGLKEPSRFKVYLHNDDYTTMEFVVEILMQVFHRTEAQATAIMLAIHHEGLGLCGVYPAEIAETKVDIVHRLARKDGFPLRCSMEEE